MIISTALQAVEQSQEEVNVIHCGREFSGKGCHAAKELRKSEKRRKKNDNLFISRANIDSQ